MGEERELDKGYYYRKSWFQRNAGLVIFMCGFLLTISGVMIRTWALANENQRIAAANLMELNHRRELVSAVPHLKDSLDVHVEQFKDFRNEQRAYNLDINRKIDKLLLRADR